MNSDNKLTIYKFEEADNGTHQLDGNNMANTRKIAVKDDFEESGSHQLSLFSMLDTEDNDYSRTLELYDAVPKFTMGKLDRVDGKYLDLFKRDFKFRKDMYEVTVRPAKLEFDNVVKGQPGSTKDFYPGKKEEYIEDALRKLAINKDCVLLDGVAAFSFTIYELQQELAQFGHTYSYDQVKESLYILTYTRIDLKGYDNGYSMTFSPIETLGIDKDDEDKIVFIRFSRPFTDSITKGKFRKLNYRKLMSLSGYISKRLFKRLSHVFTQAHIATPFEVNLSTLIRDFGVKRYSSFPHNFKKFKKDLDELVKKDILKDYNVEKMYSKERSNKIEDYKLTLFPSTTFVADVISANQEAQERKEFMRIS